MSKEKEKQRKFIELIPIPLIQILKGTVINENKAAQDFYTKIGSSSFKKLGEESFVRKNERITLNEYIERNYKEFEENGLESQQMEEDMDYMSKENMDSINTLNNIIDVIELIVTIYFRRGKGVMICIQEKSTETMLKEEKLASKYKNIIMKSVSHDLKTPLNGIIGTLDLRKQGISVSKQEIEAIHLSANLLKYKINDLLDFSTIESNEFSPSLTKININKLLLSVHEMLELQANLEKKYLSIEMPKSKGAFIFGDEQRITQILVHLLLNALKFSPARSGIGLFCAKNKPIREELLENRLDMENLIKEESPKARNLSKQEYMKEKEKWYFGVADSGYGISKANQLSLRELLNSNCSLSFVSKDSELGLGLSITNRIIRALGSKLKYQTKEGIGSTFYFKMGSSGESPDPPLSERQHAFIVQSERHSEREELQCNTSNEGEMTEREITSEEIPKVYVTQLRASRCFPFSRKIDPYPQSSTIPISSLPPLMSSAKKRKVLVVEDNGINALVVRKILNRLGVNSDWATNGQEAINLMQRYINKQKKCPFNFILMDLNMPIMGGLEATQYIIQLVREGKLDRVPIIALTAFDTDSLREKCMQIGFQEFVKKPITYTHIKALAELYST